jgi:uncharacterized DUF497 family protein
MEFEWDPAKNRSNFAKHNFDFEDAELVFAGPCVTFEDRRFDYGEERRGESTRIISMRKANRREQKIHQERLGES